CARESRDWYFDVW
nr:immunoglobulin heavy chain junction region [Mus musculus]MBK4184441.1 immunoglobulin heavy chain junction region [Mus musculus]